MVIHHGTSMGRTLEPGAAVIEGAGAHFPSEPAGLPAIGRRCPFQAMSAIVTHHGRTLGERTAELGVDIT
jgi:hypothetical protein